MLMYKGYKAVYLGLKRWRITAPYGFQFDVIAKRGISQLMDKIQYWEDRYEGDRT